MGAIAEKYCDEIILTNEDPYDENPRAIVEEIAVGIKNKKPEIIMDRREAIRRAIQLAQGMANPNNQNDTVILITGKGTDPFIMGPNCSKTPWSDKKVAEEELKRL